ncbi:GNAT family N-acetyltransferase [Macrococcus equi]|uniref:GNAT family N-acetyltransferase n=1 Tax=Macrococcus equi TaxID=3395462 RepID=UPI0039BE1598
MKLIPYTDNFQYDINQFELTEEQLKFVKSPKENLEVAKNDANRQPVFGINKEGIPVVFFVLHLHSEFEHEFGVKNSIYVRSFSTNNRYTKRGYAKQALQLMPAFIHQHYDNIDYITLLVDLPNEIAREMYIKQGFTQGQQINGERFPAYCMIKKITE